MASTHKILTDRQTDRQTDRIVLSYFAVKKYILAYLKALCVQKKTDKASFLRMEIIERGDFF